MNKESDSIASEQEMVAVSFLEVIAVRQTDTATRIGCDRSAPLFEWSTPTALRITTAVRAAPLFEPSNVPTAVRVRLRRRVRMPNAPNVPTAVRAAPLFEWSKRLTMRIPAPNPKTTTTTTARLKVNRRWYLVREATHGRGTVTCEEPGRGRGVMSQLGTC